MWRKGDPTDHDPTPERAVARPGTATAAATGAAATTSSGERASSASRSGGQATIGRSITIRGEVSGDEDLVIEGRVDGSVALGQHAVTVGPEGQVKAHITARVVTVEGRVEGDLSGEEQVVLRTSAWVEGDIVAPRVVLEDGAHFKGGVDMGQVAARGARGTAPSADGARAEGAKPERKSEGKSEGKSDGKSESVKVLAGASSRGSGGAIEAPGTKA